MEGTQQRRSLWLLTSNGLLISFDSQMPMTLLSGIKQEEYDAH
jgi:hypothetical protein